MTKDEMLVKLTKVIRELSEIEWLDDENLLSDEDVDVLSQIRMDLRKVRKNLRGEEYEIKRYYKHN